MTDSFDVRFRFHAEAVGKMRNEVRVTSELPASGGTYELATDEGEAHKGDATAPTPLHYFTAALAGCLMTQIRAFARRLDVQVNALAVDGHTRWQARLHGREPYVSQPQGFDIEVHIDSPSDPKAVVALVEAAKKGCFVEQTLAAGVHVRHRVHHAGRSVELERPST